MANLKRTQTWRVEGTLPYESSNGRTGNRNVNLQVIADDLESAVEAVRAEHPEFRFVKVMTDRWIEDVIVATKPALDPCPACNDTRWVEDKNWQPEFPNQQREQLNGLLHCAACEPF